MWWFYRIARLRPEVSCSSRLRFQGQPRLVSLSLLHGVSVRQAARHTGMNQLLAPQEENLTVVGSSMVGALNKLPVAASGMLFFGDPVTLGSVSAVTVGFLAGVVYAVAKNNQKKAESARNQADSIIPLAHRKP